jgi:hypothetical protein|nr:MAG TPA: 1,3-beta-glucan synthase component [Caudoviricetes sp.]
MSEWLIQIINYIGSKLWYDYAFWASIAYEDRDFYRLEYIRNKFLVDFFSTIGISFIVALIITTIYTFIHKSKYDIKVSKFDIFRIAIFVLFLNLFKWELILLFPLFFIAWCIAYLVLQENKLIMKGIKKIIPFIMVIFSLYLFTYVAGKVFN